MSGTDTTIKKFVGTSTLVTPKFGPGMLLQHEDLGQLTTYTRDLSRLMFRSLFGCGVVCGLVVKATTKCDNVLVTVGCGLALDCAGDPVYVPHDQPIEIEPACIPNGKKLWVVLCGTAKSCAPRPSMCASDDDEGSSVFTRERAGFEIRIVTARDCACGCPEPPKEAPKDPAQAAAPPGQPPNPLAPPPPPPFRPAEGPCYEDHYAGICKCDCGDCCECTCVLLASLEMTADAANPWKVDHRVRRVARPVLMRDPQVELDALVRTQAAEEKKKAEENEKAAEELRTTREELQKSEKARITAEEELKKIRTAEDEKNVAAPAASDAAEPAKKQRGGKS